MLAGSPGLSLHARAREGLLRLIDDRLAPRQQVLFISHLPFMVPAGRFGRVRTVIDHDNGGTRVSSEINRVSSVVARLNGLLADERRPAGPALLQEA